ncbi:MAG: DegT/DnrJ/EryC1/StrS family aminotransferase [Clostridia bacterium]
MSKLAINGGRAIGKANGVFWPYHDEKEIDALTRVVQSGNWAYMGPEEQELEREFAGFCEARHCISASNGTHTLRLALEALGIGPGDEVVVPGLTWQATAASVLDVNAIPVLADIHPDTYTLDPGSLEKALTPKTRAIIPVHLYGRMCDMDALTGIAKKHGLSVIEDCAHQHGSVWKGRKAGTIGDVGSFSLQSSKILNCGEGGLLVTDRDDLNDALRSLKNCGRPSGEDGTALQSGNYRFTEFQAAVARVQLSRLREQNEKRDRLARFLENGIGLIPGLRPLSRHPGVTFQTYYCLTFRYDMTEWMDIPKHVFINALSAELEHSVLVMSPYEPLNRTFLYRPLSKKTHMLSTEYMSMIDPGRFDLPVCRKAFEEEGVNLFHSLLLTNEQECGKMVSALEKLYDNRDELRGNCP